MDWVMMTVSAVGVVYDAMLTGQQAFVLQSRPAAELMCFHQPVTFFSNCVFIQITSQRDFLCPQATKHLKLTKNSRVAQLIIAITGCHG
jgi:hypothetical protein